MDHGDGELPAAKHLELAADEDRFSALPDDILIQILLRLGDRHSTSAAARTSVLSRRWRHLWYLLPEFDFAPESGGHIIRAILAAHEAPSLRRLSVFAEDTSPGPIAEWLPAASPLPCFGSATSLDLHLGCHALALPPSGVFARLTNLALRYVRFCGPCDLGDAVSSPRSPLLKKLTIWDTRGLSNLVIHSASLLDLELKCLEGLQLLDVLALALEALIVISCFFGHSTQSQPVANISAPKVETLQWGDAFDPSTVHFCKMANLQLLRPYHFFVYGPEDSNSTAGNQDCLRLLQRFQFDAIHTLSFVLGYETANVACDSDCVCDLPPNWIFEELRLNFLHEVEITHLRGTEHEMAFVKRLFSWATALKEMIIVFHFSISESTAKELCRKLLSFSRPGISMEFYLCPSGFGRVLYVPEE
uniref:F-box domain-containing protein n=1 Tax=Leersia perrieri TaxID=77586 RepID=A0A0D9WVD4_9ORYZ